MGGVDVKIVIELWQVVLAVFIGCGSLLSMGFGAAVVFVRRSECALHKIETSTKHVELLKSQTDTYNLIREVKEWVDIMRGMENARSKDN